MFKGLLDTHDSHSPKVKLFAAFAAEFIVNIIFRQEYLIPDRISRISDINCC